MPVITPNPRQTQTRGGHVGRAAALIAALFVAAACGWGSTPADSGSASGRATRVTVAPQPPAATLSHFRVPLEYDFTPLLAVIEKVVPRTFGSLDSVKQVGDDKNKHYAYAATRGPFTIVARGGEVHFFFTLAYTAVAYYKPPIGPTLSGSCGKGDEKPSLVVELVSPITITGSWHLRSAVRLGMLTAASTGDNDRCRISILRYDLTDQLIDAARSAIAGRLPDIDRTVGEVDISDRATGWWNRISKAIPLGNGAWLVLHPEQFRRGRISGSGHTLTVQAGLDAMPTIVIGEEPPPDVRPLPPLARDTNAAGFHIVLDLMEDYATASRAFSAELRGKKVEQGGRSVTLDSVSVSLDSGGRVALGLSFHGDAVGTLRFLGTPRYNAVRREIVVHELDYDLVTDSKIINAYAWLRSDALLATLRDGAHVPVAPLVDRGKDLLTRGLNRTMGKMMTLTTVVDSVAVVGLYATDEGLVLRGGAWGASRVVVRRVP